MYRKLSTQAQSFSKQKNYYNPKPKSRNQKNGTLLHKDCLTGNNNQGVQSRASCELTRTGDYSSACE